MCEQQPMHMHTCHAYPDAKNKMHQNLAIARPACSRAACARASCITYCRAQHDFFFQKIRLYFLSADQGFGREMAHVYDTFQDIDE